MQVLAVQPEAFPGNLLVLVAHYPLKSAHVVSVIESSALICPELAQHLKRDSGTQMQT